MMHEIVVSFARRHTRACNPCDEIAANSPYIEVFRTISETTKLDLNRYRPHGGCDCYISSKYRPSSLGNCRVEALRSGSTNVESMDLVIVEFRPNPSPYPRTTTVDANQSTETRIEIVTGAQVSGTEAGALGGSVGMSISSFFGSSAKEGISDGQHVEIPPGKGVQILRGTIVASTAIYGKLREIGTNRVLDENHFVGYKVVTTSANYLGEIVDL